MMIVRPELSLVLPVHNEADLIAASVQRVDGFLQGLSLSYEILLGDDGSTDGTADIVGGLGNPRVRIIRRPWRGKGAILSSALREARATMYLGFLDADLEIDVRYMVPMLEALAEGFDVAIASKTAEARHARTRPWVRRVATASFNFLVRLLFRTNLTDHQAGLKLFRSEILRPLLPHVERAGWLWDTEVLVRLLRADRAIKEIPVSTVPRREAKTVVPAMSAEMLMDLARLRCRLGGLERGRGKVRTESESSAEAPNPQRQESSPEQKR